jgi:hypothetical protein
MRPCAIELVLEFLHRACRCREDSAYNVISTAPVISVSVKSIYNSVRDLSADHVDRLLSYS